MGYRGKRTMCEKQLPPPGAVRSRLAERATAAFEELPLGGAHLEQRRHCVIGAGSCRGTPRDPTIRPVREAPDVPALVRFYERFLGWEVEGLCQDWG
jgi:hypothetical protein